MTISLFRTPARWRWAKPCLAVAALALAMPACRIGEGEGEVSSEKLDVQGCWNGQFRLGPNFFAANPYRRMLEIRVQHGVDTLEVSDGVSILVDDIDKVRTHIAEHPGEPLRAGLPPSVVPPGVPVVFDPDPPLVHLTLYLHRACHAQNAALYSLDGGVVFRSIFSGNLSESDVDETLTEGEFSNLVVGDPRNLEPGTQTVTHTSHLNGRFKFYFQRGQPAQPFP
jgi:hypothetical protein